MRLTKNRGQALLEYIFLLSISLMIILGLSYAFFQPLRTWMNALFNGEDSYVGCLIREGILPGGSDVCQMPKLSLKQLPPSGSGGLGSGGGGNAGGGGGGGSGSRNGEGGSQGSNQNAGNQGGTRDNNSASKGGNSGGAVGANSGFAGRDEGSGSGRGGGAGRGQGEDQSYTGSDKTSSAAGAGESGGSSSSSSISGSNSFFRRVQQSTSQAVKSVVSTNAPERVKSTREIAQERALRKKQLEEENKGLTIGGLLKYILLIALLFAIIFFVGSQIVAVARGGGRRRG